MSVQPVVSPAAPQEFVAIVEFITLPPRPYPGKPYSTNYIQLGTSAKGLALQGIVLKCGDVIRIRTTGIVSEEHDYTIQELVANAPFTGLSNLHKATFEVGALSTTIPTRTPLHATCTMIGQSSSEQTSHLCRTCSTSPFFVQAK